MTSNVLVEQQSFPIFPDVFNTGAVFTRLALNFFQRKIGLCIEKGNYTIKTVSEPAELEKVLQLRHEVFCLGRSERKPRTGDYVDQFDFACDHLIVKDKTTGMIAGAYRLNSSIFSKSFYSAKEFSIENIIKLPGVKLELGRACIRKDFRNGIIIALLWRGICEYMRLTRTKYLFGCSSVGTTDQKEISKLHQYFTAGHYSPELLRVYPLQKYATIDRSLMRGFILANNGRINRVHNYSTHNLYDYGNVQKHSRNSHPGTNSNLTKNLITSQESSFRDITIPPLLRFYLRAGAVICGEPAFDRDFRCADFFTLLDVNFMNKTVERRFANAYN